MSEVVTNYSVFINDIRPIPFLNIRGPIQSFPVNISPQVYNDLVKLGFNIIIHSKTVVDKDGIELIQRVEDFVERQAGDPVESPSYDSVSSTKADDMENILPPENFGEGAQVSANGEVEDNDDSDEEELTLHTQEEYAAMTRKDLLATLESYPSDIFTEEEQKAISRHNVTKADLLEIVSSLLARAE